MDSEILLESEKNKKSVGLIPSSYNEIDPTKTLEHSSSLKIPQLNIKKSVIYKAAPSLKESVSDVSVWLDHARGILEKEEISPDEEISFAAFSATKQGQVTTPLTPCHLLPVFPNPSTDPTMLCHAMVHMIKITIFFNPGQTAVMTFDGPLYILAKKLQWTYPELVGEDKLLLLPGGLHIEKLWWETIGSLLEGSGWTTLLSNADIATPGRAQSYLMGSHIYRSRYMHQVTAIALNTLMHRSYQEYVRSVQVPFRIQELDEWLERKAALQPQVMFWDKVLQYEMLGLQVRN